jgi:hypothetical protein
MCKTEHPSAISLQNGENVRYFRSGRRNRHLEKSDNGPPGRAQLRCSARGENPQRNSRDAPHIERPYRLPQPARAAQQLSRAPVTFDTTVRRYRVQCLISRVTGQLKSLATTFKELPQCGGVRGSGTYRALTHHEVSPEDVGSQSDQPGIFTYFR